MPAGFEVNWAEERRKADLRQLILLSPPQLVPYPWQPYQDKAFRREYEHRRKTENEQTHLFLVLIEFLPFCAEQFADLAYEQMLHGYHTSTGTTDRTRHRGSQP